MQKIIKNLHCGVMPLCNDLVCLIKASVYKSKSLGRSVYPFYQSLHFSSSRSAEAATRFKQQPLITFNGRHSRCIEVPMLGLYNRRYFAVSSQAVSRILTSQAYIPSVWTNVGAQLICSHSLLLWFRTSGWQNRRSSASYFGSAKIVFFSDA
jgi:hypothetical protein